MTPAETLRAAADRLDALDKAAPGGIWERVTDYVHIDVRRDVEVVTTIPDPESPATWPLLDMLDGSLEEREAGAALICALRPLAAPLAVLLRQAAEEDAETVRDYGEFVSERNLLTVARAILGEPA